MGKRKSRSSAKAAKKTQTATPASVTTPAPVRATAPARTRRTVEDDMWLMAKATLIVVLGLAVYIPALSGAWLWDDRELIADSLLIHDPNGWWKIWLYPRVMFDFQPVEVTVTWTLWRLFGEETLGYHIVNMVLHLTSALLLWRLLYKLGLRHAWLGGLIFAVHPVLVESVAWIAELKNTLSLPFFLLALMAWIDYDAHGRWGTYVRAIIFFTLAMLTKATMVTFPFVILLYAWWRRARVTWKDVLASAPFFLVSLAVGLAVVYWLNQTHGEQKIVLGGLWSRIACAGLCIAFYFSKCVLPVTLLAIYPKWQIDPPSPIQFLPWPVLAGVAGFLWYKRKSWGRHALMGLGFFIIMLLPFLGLNAGSYMNLGWVMDHIVYIPIIGLIALAVAMVDGLALQLSPVARRAGAVVIAAAVAGLAWSANGYAALYSGLLPFWEYNAAHMPTSAFVHNNYAVSLANTGHEDEAAAQVKIALQINPDYTDALRNLGRFYCDRHEYSKALEAYAHVVRVDPALPDGKYNVAVTLGLLGRNTEAEAMYRETILTDPSYVMAYHNLASMLADQNRLEEANNILTVGVQLIPYETKLTVDLAEVKRRMQVQQKR